jgi:hypothetical protein
MALATKKVPLWVVGPNGGGLDTKTNPKMLGPGAVLEATNVDEFRPGEYRVRRGFSILDAADSSVKRIFATASGGLARARSFSAFGYSYQARTPVTGLPYGGSVAQYVAPCTVKLKAVEASEISGGNVTQPVFPDIARNGAWELTTFFNNRGIGDPASAKLLDSTTRTPIAQPFAPTGTTINGRAPLAVATANYVAYFEVTTAGTLSIATVNTNNGATNRFVAAVAGVDVASPWLDIIPAFGVDTVAYAFKRAAGGVTVGSVDLPSGLNVLGPNVFAGIDASMCLGWLQDPAFTSNRYYLASAGSVAGALYNTFNSALGAITATTPVNAARTANVNNITGYIQGATVAVIYDVINAAPMVDAIYSFTTAEQTVGVSVSLASKAGLCNGRIMVVGTCASTVQPCYMVLEALPGGQRRPAAAFLAGEGTGRRPQCSLSAAAASPLAGETTNMYVAVGRKRSIATPGSAAVQKTQVMVVEIADALATVTPPRELGGTLFLGGGGSHADDGVAFGFATFQLTPELTTAAVGAVVGGALLTALGTYTYRLTYRRVDSSGRVQRSAASVPQTVTLTGGQNAVALVIAPAPIEMNSGEYVYTVEVWRQGPAATGATGYNLATTIDVSTNGTPPATTSVNDTTSDTVANAAEYAYFNGNTLENFPPPSSSIVESGNGRIWAVNSEYPTEVWYSKEYKQGVGLGFNFQNTFRIEGDGRGALRGIVNMDGRMVFFKDASIWVVSGDGPNDLGQGSFSSPQAVSLTVGLLSQASIVRVPDGVLFQASTGGIWLLDRGLGLTPAGSPVDSYLISVTATSPTPVVASSQVTASTFVRFCLASGRVLVFNYLTKRWTTYTVPVGASAIVGCADTTIYGWCYLLADGTVYQESQTALTDAGGATIVPQVSFPHLQFAGLNGYQRLKGLDIAIDVVGNHTLSVDAEYDFSGAVTGAPKTIALTTATPTAQVEYTPPEGRAKCSAVRPVLTIQGAAAGSSFRLVGAVANIGVKKGSNIPASSRLT